MSKVVSGVEFNPSNADADLPETAGTTSADNPTDLAAKIAAAQAAMEGKEHAEKRERAEKQQSADQEKTTINSRLGEIAKQKEALEIEWIRHDDRRKNTRLTLAPVLEQEKQIEEEEAKTEIEEAKIGVPQERQIVEKKRIAIQNRRQEIETRKWELEEQVWKAEAAIEENTKKYRTLLDEEDKLKSRLAELASAT